MLRAEGQGGCAGFRAAHGAGLPAAGTRAQAQPLRNPARGRRQTRSRLRPGMHFDLRVLHYSAQPDYNLVWDSDTSVQCLLGPCVRCVWLSLRPPLDPIRIRMIVCCWSVHQIWAWCDTGQLSPCNRDIACAHLLLTWCATSIAVLLLPNSPPLARSWV